MFKTGTRLWMKPGYLHGFYFPGGELQEKRLLIGPDYAGRSAASGKVSLIRSSTAAMSLRRHMVAFFCRWRHPKRSLEGFLFSSFFLIPPPSFISPLGSDTAAECVFVAAQLSHVLHFTLHLLSGCQEGSGERLCATRQNWILLLRKGQK